MNGGGAQLPQQLLNHILSLFLNEKLSSIKALNVKLFVINKCNVKNKCYNNVFTNNFNK